MKKTLTIIMLLACIFTLTACGKNMNVKESDMTNELTKMGFDVNDITDSIEDSDKKLLIIENIILNTMYLKQKKPLKKHIKIMQMFLRQEKNIKVKKKVVLAMIVIYKQLILIITG